LKTHRRVEAAQADTKADQALLNQLKLATELDIRQQHQLREEARQRVQATKEGLSAAQEGYHLALHRYDLGLANQTELADAQNTLVSARENGVQAEKDLAIAEIKLRRALGLDLAQLGLDHARD
jgi:outer membrane protein